MEKQLDVAAAKSRLLPRAATAFFSQSERFADAWNGPAGREGRHKLRGACVGGVGTLRWLRLRVPITPNSRSMHPSLLEIAAQMLGCLSSAIHTPYTCPSIATPADT